MDRYPALDGMRGIAALAVVVSHSAAFYWLQVGKPAGALGAALKQFAHAGQLAVVLFFVLSGFVLYVAFARRPSLAYVPYMVRRVFRLYPALLASIALALLLRFALAPVWDAGLSDRANANLTQPTDVVNVVRHILLLASAPLDTNLNPVIWSLALELRFSALLIPLALLANRWPRALLILAGVSYISATLLAGYLNMTGLLLSGTTTAEAFVITLYYLPGFCLGILAGRLVLSGVTIPLSRLVTALIVLGAAAMITDDKALWAAAFAVLVYMASGPGLLTAALTNRPAKFLGDISYSLYLVHYPVLLACLYLLHSWSALAAVVIAPALSISLSAVLYRTVELPGIELGKSLLAQVQPRTAA